MKIMLKDVEEDLKALEYGLDTGYDYNDNGREFEAEYYLDGYHQLLTNVIKTIKNRKEVSCIPKEVAILIPQLFIGKTRDQVLEIVKEKAPNVIISDTVHALSNDIVERVHYNDCFEMQGSNIEIIDLFLENQDNGYTGFTLMFKDGKIYSLIKSRYIAGGDFYQNYDLE